MPNQVRHDTSVVGSHPSPRRCKYNLSDGQAGMRQCGKDISENQAKPESICPAEIHVSRVKREPQPNRAEPG